MFRLGCLKVHMHKILKDKAEVKTFKKFVKWRVKFSYKIGFSQIPRYRRKRTVSLCIFGKNATFNSPFSPTMISLTPHFRRKVWLPFYAENAQNDPKTHNYEDNAKFHSAFSPTKLSYASRFRRNRGVIENFEYLGEIEEDFQKSWLYCILYLLVIERCKNKFKNWLWKSRACVPLRTFFISPALYALGKIIHWYRFQANVIW